MFNPSKYQKAIFSFIEKEQGNAIIEAVAGSGKTTTIVEALKKTSGNAVFLAFNKSIATELKARVPEHVQARTFHSLCYTPVLKAIGAREVNTQKIDSLMREIMPVHALKMYGGFVKKLVGLARQAGWGCLVPANTDIMHEIVDHHMIILNMEDADQNTGVNWAKQILETSNSRPSADFDDLLYFAVLKGVRLPSFDWVFVDEAQDTNAIQRAILRKILGHGGRLVAVGDSAQAIYGFRGADSEALNLLADDFAPCKRLPLSVTYRCAQTITAMAQEYVPHIEARPGAPEGEVLELGIEWKIGDLGAQDLVVCRNTKPLVALGWKLMRNRIPVKILGREIGEGLISLINKCDGGSGEIDHFLEKLEAWSSREIEKALSKGLDGKAEAIEDKTATLAMLANSLPEDRRIVAELKSVIESLFAEGTNRVTLATVHKSKGLEADRVWWLAKSLCPSKWAKRPWQQQQETNIMYVACTRAKTSLRMIELDEEREAA